MQLNSKLNAVKNSIITKSILFYFEFNANYCSLYIRCVCGTQRSNELLGDGPEPTIILQFITILTIFRTFVTTVYSIMKM